MSNRMSNYICSLKHKGTLWFGTWSNRSLESAVGKVMESETLTAWYRGKTLHFPGPVQVLEVFVAFCSTNVTIMDTHIVVVSVQSVFRSIVACTCPKYFCWSRWCWNECKQHAMITWWCTVYSIHYRTRKIQWDKLTSYLHTCGSPKIQRLKTCHKY